MKNETKNSVWAAFLAVIIGISLGCGGGGGGPSSGGSGGNVGGAIPLAGQYLEVVGGGGAVDPLNLGTNASYTVQFVNYDQVGVRTVLSASNFTLIGTGSPHVSLTSNGFLSVTSDPAVNFRVTATATVSGVVKTLSQDCRIARGNATVSGRVISSNGVTGIVYVQVDIYDVNLNRVGGALTGTNGNFTATCPSTAQWITLKSTTIPDTFFAAMSYQGKDYSVFGTTCLAKLPTLSAGGNTLPASMIVPRLLDGPPPPPSGGGS